ncbi:MAG: hypothetical protein K6G31_07690 [Paludibacteraceae bacterium]|nr:hypothetical protein [Paludibacteraceae bacterium]
MAEIASFNPDERSIYEESLKNLWDLNNCLDTAKRNGHDEGFAEGRAEGEAMKNIEHARKMKAKGYPIADIADITGLSLSEIEKL